jgi:NADPH-dependent curcumin reductase CurA
MNGLLPQHWPRAREELFALYARGLIQVTFDSCEFRGLPSVFDAVERLLSGQSMGKVVVDLRSAASAD